MAYTGISCSDLITVVPRCWGWIIFLLNIILPGFGTMLSACWANEKTATAGEIVCFGVVQLLMVPCCLTGWILSIVAGF